MQSRLENDQPEKAQNQHKPRDKNIFFIKLNQLKGEGDLGNRQRVARTRAVFLSIVRSGRQEVRTQCLLSPRPLCMAVQVVNCAEAPSEGTEWGWIQTVLLGMGLFGERGSFSCLEGYVFQEGASFSN